ncbi:hypothetical protein MB901379_03878 [Mycobacterium basiliense]|uniref:Uncharacterized protein n=1 Tax=Mycobacterium basiliense TaxID=2094119 RepID=A0A447GIG0_9MYCO|nr:hypothetical protein [Mycobacterium basiliense]VDM90282.1 hypothetical protein MB901379_03878 [Mycobacterium basiliense]
MAIKLSLPQDAGQQTQALADQLQTMMNDRDQRYSDQELRDTAISALISIVAGLERDVAELKETEASAKRQATWDELQRKSYER